MRASFGFALVFASIALIPCPPLRGQGASKAGIAQSTQRIDSTQLIIAELRAQNQLMREYDQRLIGTVFWSLGAVVVLVGLLVGFGWNANARSYERDRASLRQELQGLAREEAAKLQDQLSQRTTETTKWIEEKFSGLSLAVSEKAETAAKNVHRHLKSQIDELGERVLREELQALAAEADMWAARPIPSNELSVVGRIIRKAQDLKFEYLRDDYIANSLDRIRNILKSKPRLDAKEVANLVAVLDAVPNKFTTEVDSLKSLIHNMRSA